MEGGALLTDTVLSRKNAMCWYITMRRTRARELMWDSSQTGIKMWNKELDMGLDFHNTNLEATAPQTDGVIRLMGAETRGDIDKLRGEPFDIAVIDEARNFPPKLLRMLIRDVLQPSTADFGGRIVMMSNPGKVLAGPFYDVTKPNAKKGFRYGLPEWETKKKWDWSTHHWNAKDNTANPAIWEAFLSLKEAEGWSDHNPTWMTEYLGEWAGEDSDFVFRFNPEKNTYTPDPQTPYGLPAGHKWEFICGMDFGVVDDFAIVVMATAPTSIAAYEVYTYKKARLTIAECVEAYKRAEGLFGGFSAVVGDVGGLGKLAEVEFERTYGIYMEPAQKQQRLTYIELLNADFVDSRIFIRKESPLRDELQYLQWADEEKKKTVRGQKDHAADAFLYNWRRSLHHEGKRLILTPQQGTAEWNRIQHEQGLKALLRKQKRQDTLDSPSRLEDGLDLSHNGLLGYNSEWD